MKISNVKNWLASRSRRAPCTTIVLHATDGASAGSSISWLRQIGLSYHYVIERDGAITKCVPISRVAFHAGRSFGPGGSNVNNYSIGIAFANFESRRERITNRQLQACVDLVAALATADPSIQWLTRHLDISPGRKSDPAMLFDTDYKAIAKAGKLKIWRT